MRGTITRSIGYPLRMYWRILRNRKYFISSLYVAAWLFFLFHFFTGRKKLHPNRPQKQAQTGVDFHEEDWCRKLLPDLLRYCCCMCVCLPSWFACTWPVARISIIRSEAYLVYSSIVSNHHRSNIYCPLMLLFCCCFVLLQYFSS